MAGLGRRGRSGWYRLPSGLAWSLVVAGALLLLLVGVLSIARRPDSEAFWLFSVARQHTTAYTVTLHTPDGQSGRPLLSIPDAYRPEKIHPAPDGQALYFWVQDQDGHYAFQRLPLAAPGRPQPVLADIAYSSYQQLTGAPGGEWVVFYAARTRLAELYRMPRGGGPPELLRTHYEPVVLRDWAWSPDGRWLSYSALGQRAKTHVINLHTGEDHYVANIAAPAIWEPDGSPFFLMNRRAAGRPAVDRIDRRTFRATRLTAELVAYQAVAWPLAEWAVLQDEAEHLYRIRPDGSALASLLPEPAQVLSAPAVRGTCLLVQYALEDGQQAVACLHPATGARQVLGQVGGQGRVVARTSGGELVQLAPDRAGNWAYFLVDPDADALRRLAGFPTPADPQALYAAGPLVMAHHLSPDGRWLYAGALARSANSRTLNQARWRIRLADGQVESLPLGYTIGFSPPFDRPWQPSALGMGGLGLWLAAAFSRRSGNRRQSGAA